MSKAVSRAFRPASLVLALITCIEVGAVGNVCAQTVAGTPIVDFIADLRARGITVIYSSDLVPASLLVSEPPTASDPIGQLREVLAPHALTLQAGPNGSWLVIRAAESRVAPPAPPTPSAAAPAAPPLELVVVSASRYAFGRSTGPSEERIDRARLENAPVLGEDALRTTPALPGVTSSGLSARVNVRGGESNEALVLLDGVRLYNPYHLKDFESLFGGISPRVLDVIDVRTGGYPAEYGDRMSAVIDMRSIDPGDRRHYEIGLSTLTSSVLSSGRFGNGRGAWVTSLRRGNLDLLIDLAGSDVGQPEYADFFNKVSFTVNDRLAVTTGALSLDDKIELRDAGSGEAYADYDDNYLWLSIEHDASAKLSGRYLLSRARLHSTRRGRIDEPTVVSGSLDDTRRFVLYALEADWSLDVSESGLFRFGLMLNDADAAYAFAANRTIPYPIMPPSDTQLSNPTAAVLDLHDRRRGAYASYRLRPFPRLTTELGLRWDEQAELEDSQLSPRLGALLDLGERATLRASWGRFYQAQGIDELQIGDGLTTVFPAQESEHSVVSLEYLFGEGLSLRLELYRKVFEHLRPRFENMLTRVSLLPELLPDRIQIAPLDAEARGAELSFAGGQGAWQWWANWTWAEVEDRLPGGSAARSWAEPWSAKGGWVHMGSRWTVSAQLTMRAGWPLTGLALVGNELVAGALNAEHFERYRSLDLRASRRFMLEHGDIEFFVELENALNEDNPCCFDYELDMDTAGLPVELRLDGSSWLPAIPSFGFRWTF